MNLKGKTEHCLCCSLELCSTQVMEIGNCDLCESSQSITFIFLKYSCNSLHKVKEDEQCDDPASLLRWVRIRFKAYGSERQFSHRFRSPVVTTLFGQLLYCWLRSSPVPLPAARNLSALHTQNHSSSTKSHPVLRQRFLALTTVRQKPPVSCLPFRTSREPRLHW